MIFVSDGQVNISRLNVVVVVVAKLIIAKKLQTGHSKLKKHFKYG
jgi:hypothetical protein